MVLFSVFSAFVSFIPRWIRLKVRKLTESTAHGERSQQPEDNSLPRNASHKELKASLSSLSFAAHDAASASGTSSKRASLKLSNNVMGKIKDRTGIPV